MGFEGPDLEVKHRVEVTRRAGSISMSDIRLGLETGKYIVLSQSDPQISYEVNLEAYDCTCLSFPLIRFCKHICAIQRYFPENIVKIPVAALNSTDPDDSPDALDISDADSSEPDDGDGLGVGHHSDLVVEDLTERLQSLAVAFALIP
jgi:hypothetical protein